jgi:RNAse (barnase) inhibitor barstar
MPERTFHLDGGRIRDIPSFYDELNRVFMHEVDWQLGQSLDALDDMLYGGYGTADGDGPVTVVWEHHERSRVALGIAATRAYYENKIAHPEVFDTARARRQLDALEDGSGPSYFEIVLDVFASHPRFTLVLA